MSEGAHDAQDALDAAVFRRLLHHLDGRKDVQNIDLMILAGFCRNCLSRWYEEEASKLGHNVDRETSRERIYGMPYTQWKREHQPPATEEQLAAFAALQPHKEG